MATGLRARAGALWEAYCYAANSNRLLSVSNGSTTRSFSYTSAGNISLDDRGTAGQDYGLIYSNDNRLAELTQASQTKATYGHSDSGERLRKTLPGSPATETHYLYDRDGALIGEVDPSAGALREYISLGGIPIALVTGAQLAFVHADHLGTPQAMTDGTQAQVWDVTLRPFGGVESQTGTPLNPQRFSGQLADDEAGYHDNVWRTYDPSLGCYLQSDPIGLTGGLNTFAYVGGNPTMFVDPTGEYAQVFLALCIRNPAACARAAMAATAAVAWAMNMGTPKKVQFCLLGPNYYADPERNVPIVDGMTPAPPIVDDPGSKGPKAPETPNLPEGYTPAPALHGDPYHPAEVDKRRSRRRAELGAPSLDPDKEIPDQGPGGNPGGHRAKSGKGHETGERNVNPNEEHSRRPKGNPTGRPKRK